MKLRGALLAATVLAMPIAASAQPVTGLYVGLGAGVNITTKEQVKNLSFPTLAPLGSGLSTSGNITGSAGFAGNLALGWGFGNGLRAELEGLYRITTSAVIRASGLPALAVAPMNRNTAAWPMSCMISTACRRGSCRISVSALAISASQKTIHFYNTAPIARTAIGTQGLGIAWQHTEGSFAYQAIIGAAFPLPQIAPGLAFTAEYRFLGTTGNRTYGGTATAANTAGAVFAVPASVQLGPTYNNQIMVGLRYNFGVAPPPPPPAAAVPAQAPARSYLVFFDWDKATLTDRARQIIGEAADNSTKVQYTRIEVNGYTDTSGTQQYNQGLSIRRAKAVQAELVKDGVPPATRSPSRASATRTCWCRPVLASASRRTAASRSSSADQQRLVDDDKEWGAARRPFSSVPEEGQETCGSVAYRWRLALSGIPAGGQGTAVPGRLYRCRRRPLILPKRYQRLNRTSAGSPHLESTRRSVLSALGSIGYGLGNGIRFEVEGNLPTAQHLEWQGPGSPSFQRQHEDLWRDGQCAVRHGYRRALAVPVYRCRRGYAWTNLHNFTVTPSVPPLGVVTSNDTHGCVRLAGDSRLVVSDAEYARPFADQRVSLPAAPQAIRVARR